MSFSITGFSYLTLSFALGFFIYRIFQYWRKEKDFVSKLWLCIFFLFWLFTFIQAVGGLFFATNLTFLRFEINFGVFLQAIAFSVMSYFSVYVKLSPKISPWVGFIPVFILGMISTYLTIIVPSSPFLEPSGAINWGSPVVPDFGGILRISLFLIAFIPAIFILLEQFQKTQDVYTKRRALGFIILFFIVIIGASFDFIFVNIFKLDSIWRDIAFIFASIVILVAIVPGQKEGFIKK
jgi:hypothetical protein